MTCSLSHFHMHFIIITISVIVLLPLCVTDKQMFRNGCYYFELFTCVDSLNSYSMSFRWLLIGFSCFIFEELDVLRNYIALIHTARSWKCLSGFDSLWNIHLEDTLKSVPIHLFFRCLSVSPLCLKCGLIISQPFAVSFKSVIYIVIGMTVQRSVLLSPVTVASKHLERAFQILPLLSKGVHCSVHIRPSGTSVCELGAF